MGVLPVPPSVRLPTLTTGTVTRCTAASAAVVAAIPPMDCGRVNGLGQPQPAAHHRRAKTPLVAAQQIAKTGQTSKLHSLLQQDQYHNGAAHTARSGVILPAPESF